MVGKYLYIVQYRSLNPGGGGTPHMKGMGMLVVSLRDINFGF